MPYNVPSDWRRFIYDSENRVFEIMDGLDIRPCGELIGFAGQRRIGGVSFHPNKELAAFVTEDGMTVSDFHGHRLWDYKAPVTTLLFSRSGDELWIAEKFNSEKFLISVVDIESGMEISANTMEDPLYDSHLRLSHAPESVLLELAAGQDGCEIWELDDTDATMRYHEVFPNHCHIMPVFSPDGKRLLTMENDERLFYSYTWPGAEIITRQRDFTEAELEEEEAMPVYSMVLLKKGLAVVKSALNRLYLFDTDRMERREELVIEGFEPAPANEFSPNLSDKLPYIPIERFERYCDVLIAVTSKDAKNHALAIINEAEATSNLSVPQVVICKI